MSGEIDIKPLSTSELEVPSQIFAAFCEAEFERRKNTGEQFDEGSYREAMAMTVRKLKALEEEGYA